SQGPVRSGLAFGSANASFAARRPGCAGPVSSFAGRITLSIGHPSVLGLVVGERSIIAAEVAITRDRRQVKRTAQFIFPDTASLEKPEELGTALAQFLRQNHFSSSRAVIGVPARWLMARDKDLPPASA